ncbi:MAG: bifunctional homocysteine S-methyltransferase/methylenetetrahydrofolate reductase [Myxococcales bacterium]|nr:bifunctional homocysteine S-methyltransferase/methylenetetrahydrofolate reductase [Myxococcales bacterium]
MTNTNAFLAALERGPLVVDGAMGTQLYERGVFINRSLEEVCLRNPSLVQQIHEDYIAAGADLIETHTFAANRLKLAKHGLEDKLVELNRAAVQIARRCADRGKVLVGGAIGPTGAVPGVISDAELERVRDAFKEQAAILADGGVDVFVLETFRLLSELRLAVQAVQAVSSLPIIAQVAFDGEERTSEGADPEQVFTLLRDLGVDVIGANCVEGPHQLFSVAEKMVGRGIPIAIQPNAGYPKIQEGRHIYMATPEYFGVYARRFFKLGVSLVGGCCGTSPEHIRRIVGAARMMGGGRVEARSEVSVVSTPDRERYEGVEPTPTAEKTGLGAAIARVYHDRVKAKEPVPVGPESFVVSVEVNPPNGLDPSKALAAARLLREGGVNVVNIADGPRASVRMSNQALGLLIQRELDMEVILHVCCRDRNLLGLQSDLLADHVLGLHNLVIITGDPPKMGDYPHATPVFDVDSVGLLRIADNFNHGRDLAGKKMDPTRFLCACGAEPAALDYDREIRRLEQKREAGAEFIMTQPVYDPEILHRFIRDTRHLDMPILVGLLPLASHRNAEFLHNEVPGMQIPQDIRDRMQKVDRGPAARAEGVRIAQEALLGVVDDVVGAYIMPPFGRYSLALDILTCVGYTRPESQDKAS